LSRSSTTQQQHGCHNCVGREAEEKEGDVGIKSPSGLDNFTHSVCRRSHLFNVNGQDTKQNDLNGGT
jgi:hypothetical protein